MIKWKKESKIYNNSIACADLSKILYIYKAIYIENVIRIMTYAMHREWCRNIHYLPPRIRFLSFCLLCLWYVCFYSFISPSPFSSSIKLKIIYNFQKLWRGCLEKRSASYMYFETLRFCISMKAELSNCGFYMEFQRPLSLLAFPSFSSWNDPKEFFLWQLLLNRTYFEVCTIYAFYSIYTN